MSLAGGEGCKVTPVENSGAQEKRDRAKQSSEQMHWEHGLQRGLHVPVAPSWPWTLVEPRAAQVPEELA